MKKFVRVFCKFCVCNETIVGKTSYSLVKFPALSFKIETKQIFFPPTLIFSKTFFLQNNTQIIQIQRKKQIEFFLNIFEVMVEKPIMTNPLGEWRHLVEKFKKFFHNFFLRKVEHKHNAKNRLKKFSLEKKLQPIEI
jgi:hypothetical protein